MKYCNECTGECCRYVTADLDKPTDPEDWDEIKWYVMHKDVIIYKDEDDEWFVEFRTKCRHLGPDNRCKIYDKKPLVCKEHHVEECDINESNTVIAFREPEDVDKYLRSKKK